MTHFTLFSRDGSQNLCLVGHLDRSVVCAHSDTQNVKVRFLYPSLLVCSLRLVIELLPDFGFCRDNISGLTVYLLARN